MNYVIKFKRGNTERWNIVNPILDYGEPGICFLDDNSVIIKVGDGIKTWGELPILSDTKTASTPPVSYNFTNGLVNDGSNNISFGGLIDGTTFINMDGTNSNNNFGIKSVYNDPLNGLDNCYSGLIFEQGDFINNSQDAGLYLACYDGTTTRGAFVTKFGLRYRDDYSAEWDNRYLVDKGYVDNLVSGITAGTYTPLTFSNGFTNTDGVVTLGGAITSDTTIALDGHQLIFGRDSTGTGPYLTLMDAHNLFIGNNSANYSAEIQVDEPYGVYFSYSNNQTGLSFGVGLKDSVFAYDNDYSANYTDRSLVDKGYVDTLFSGLGGGATVVPSETTLPQLNWYSSITNSSGTISLSSNENGVGSTIELHPYNLRFLYGNGTNDYILSMSSGSFTISDDVNQRGIEYIADYSSNYTDRSLVDKAYVNSLLSGGSVAYNNGITLTNNELQLGGLLVVPTTISLGYNNTFRIINGDEQPNIAFLETDNNIGIKISAGEGLLSESYIHLQRQNDPTIKIHSSKVGEFELNNMYNTIYLTDFRVEPRGIEYSSDYSATFNGNSLVTKNYVDNLLGNSATPYSNITSNIDISTTTTDNIQGSGQQTIHIFRGSNMEFNQSLDFGFSTGTDDYIMMQNNASPTIGRYSNFWFGNSEIKLENSNSNTPFGNSTSSFVLDYNGFNLNVTNNLGGSGIKLTSDFGLQYTNITDYNDNTLVNKLYVEQMILSKITIQNLSYEPTLNTDSMCVWRNSNTDDIYLVANVNGTQKKIQLT